MALTNGKLLRTYEAEDPRLGRHLELDSRSQPYFIEKLLAQPVAIKPAEWLPAIPTLDQGRVGSCTGNAGTYAISSLFGDSGLQNIKFDGLGLTNYEVISNEKFALALYHESTVLDGFPGTYPPEDTGSSGLGVCKALQSAGLIGSYVWATSLEGIGVLLQNGGLLIGMPWYKAFFEPDAQGFIDSGHWEASGVAGGHEVYCEALEAWSDQPERSVVRIHNSWGDAFGEKGCFRMRLSTYLALASEIDIKGLVAKAA